MIRSNVQHFRLTTTNLAAMVGWYARVFGMVPRHSSRAAEEAQTTTRLNAAWSSNDHANPRITILSVSGLTAQPRQSRRPQPQHVTFECATVDDLLNAYERLKGLGIEPVVTVHHGVGATFYYEDPDHNVVELKLDNLGHAQKSFCDPRTSLQPSSTHVDPEKMIAARAAGMSVAELHQHAYAGGFPPPLME
jgi:catechol 2,3-dioxygenase-like lactoylglutathione lyase family enzyme